MKGQICLIFRLFFVKMSQKGFSKDVMNNTKCIVKKGTRKGKINDEINETNKLN